MREFELKSLIEKYDFKETPKELRERIEARQLHPIYKKHLAVANEIQAIWGHVSHSELSMGRARELTTMAIEAAIGRHLIEISGESPLEKFKGKEYSHIFQPIETDPTSVKLTMKQVSKASIWFANRSNVWHLQNGKYSGLAIRVTREDSNAPELWKPGHWKWFFEMME